MNSKTKISIRFFDDKEVRAIWDEEMESITLIIMKKIKIEKYD